MDHPSYRFWHRRSPARLLSIVGASGRHQVREWDQNHRQLYHRSCNSSGNFGLAVIPRRGDFPRHLPSTEEIASGPLSDTADE